MRVNGFGGRTEEKKNEEFYHEPHEPTRIKEDNHGEHGGKNTEGHGEGFAIKSLFVLYTKLISYIFSYVQLCLKLLTNITY